MYCGILNLYVELSGFQRMFHRGGHLHLVFGVGDSGVEEYAVGAKFHGDDDVGVATDYCDSYNPAVEGEYSYATSDI